MPKRLKLTFAAGEWRPVKELLKRRYPYLAPSTAAKLILLELAENTMPINEAVTRGAFESPAVPDSHPESPGVPCPDPTLARAGTDPGKKKEEKKKERKESGLAPLSVSEEVIGYLNKMAGSNQRPSAESHRKLIQARLNDGATVEDLKTVIRKMCAVWNGTPMAVNLKPSCLFRASNFDGYLGQPEPGNGARPKESVTQKQARQQDFAPRGEWK